MKNKSLKRMVALSMAAVMTAALFTGCGKTEEPAAAPETKTEEPAAEEPAAEAPAAEAEEAKEDAPAWPDSGDTITYIVGFKPGGSGGAQGMIAEEYMEKYLGCDIALEYVPGSGGLLGFNKLFTMDSGYAMDWSNTIDGIWSFSTLSPTEVPWKVEDFKTLGIVTNLINQGMICTKDAPWDTFPQLIEDAKSRPGEITVASIGPGRLEDLYVIEIMEYFGVEFNWVFYDGSSTIQTDLLTGDIDVGLVGINESFVDHPEFKVITGMAKEYPDDWALKDSFKNMSDWQEEMGYKIEDLPAFNIPGNASWVVKADTPDYIYDALCEAVRQTANDPGWQEAMKAYTVPTYIDPVESQKIYDEVTEIFESYVPLHEKYVKR